MNVVQLLVPHVPLWLEYGDQYEDCRLQDAVMITDASSTNVSAHIMKSPYSTPTDEESKSVETMDGERPTTVFERLAVFLGNNAALLNFKEEVSAMDMEPAMRLVEVITVAHAQIAAGRGSVIVGSATPFTPVDILRRVATKELDGLLLACGNNAHQRLVVALLAGYCAFLSTAEETNSCRRGKDAMVLVYRSLLQHDSFRAAVGGAAGRTSQFTTIDTLLLKLLLRAEKYFFGYATLDCPSMTLLLGDGALSFSMAPPAVKALGLTHPRENDFDTAAIIRHVARCGDNIFFAGQSPDLFSAVLPSMDSAEWVSSDPLVEGMILNVFRSAAMAPTRLVSCLCAAEEGRDVLFVGALDDTLTVLDPFADDEAAIVAGRSTESFSTTSAVPLDAHMSRVLLGPVIRVADVESGLVSGEGAIPESTRVGKAYGDCVTLLKRRTSFALARGSIVELWDLESESRVFNTDKTGEHHVSCMTSDGKDLLAVGEEGKVHLFDLRRGPRPVKTFYDCHYGAVTSLTLVGQVLYTTSAVDTHARLRGHLLNGHRVWENRASAEITSPIVSLDGGAAMAYGSGDGILHVRLTQQMAFL